MLSCLSSVASRWIGPRLFDWQAGHPDATVRLVGAEAEPRLTGDLVDFRICYGYAVRSFEHHAELFTDRVVPACAPALLQGRRLGRPADLLQMPLIAIEWEPAHGAPPHWKEWAASIGAAMPLAQGSELTFSLSSAAIDAAVHGHGVVLAQVSMIAGDLASGRLVAPFDHRLVLSQPYFLAWDRAALQKLHGAEFRAWLLSIAKQQADASLGPLPRVTAALSATDPRQTGGTGQSTLWRQHRIGGAGRAGHTIAQHVGERPAADGG